MLCWFPDEIPCCGCDRNAKHIALTSREHSQSSAALLPFSALLPPLHQKKHDFSMVSESAAPCFLTWSHVFRRFQEESSRISCLGPTNKDQVKHHSNHHQNLNRHHHHHRDHIISSHPHSNQPRQWPQCEGKFHLCCAFLGSERPRGVAQHERRPPVTDPRFPSPSRLIQSNVSVKYIFNSPSVAIKINRNDQIVT